MFDRNIPYNDLPLLPPAGEIIDNEVLTKWGLASRALAELNKNILRLPNPYMLVNTISLQEARSSSEIEHIFTTNDELYKAVSESIREENANPNIKEVLRYREALWTGYQHIKSKNQLDTEAILQVYQQIKNTNQGFRSPQSQTTIKRGQSEFKPGEIVYTPPRGKDVIEAKITNLLEFLNSRQDSLDPLLKMVIGHYQFEAIHPFTDGNGRTGRVINLLYLVNQGLLSHPVLYLSKYIIQNKNDYYHHLAGVTQRNAWKTWILFMLEGVGQTAALTNQLIDEIIIQMNATLEYGNEHLKWYNKKLNEALFSQPYIKPALLEKILGRTSRTTLTKYMSDLVKLQIVSPKQDGKQVFYMNDDLIRILGG